MLNFIERKNKLGEEKIISIYWFLVLILVATAIVLMVNSFYNSPYDVREVESQILSEKIADCIDKGGKLNSQLISNGSFSKEFEDKFLEKCSIYLDYNEDGEIQEYFKVDIYNRKNSLNPVFNISKGNPNWKSDCYLEDKDHEKIVKCVENNFYSSDVSDNVYLIKILTIVRKTEQNVKL
ncbi:MAG: hypothetical protein WC812_03625 [Candidatus Pacearchaeota archaeon]|jgi:hypothetical protein